jgi:hypothetical protein
MADFGRDLARLQQPGLHLFPVSRGAAERVQAGLPIPHVCERRHP